MTDGLRAGLDPLAALVGDRAPERLADIHATVDLERRLGELGRSVDDATAAVADTLLGARVVVLEREVGPAIALAEPTTEGRLAAALARQGEGVVGEYLALPDAGSLEAVVRRARKAGVALSSAAAGPFGRAVIVLGGPIGGRQVILVERGSIPSG